MSNTFVIGDIHGNYKALLQCLEQSKFNYEEDTLIQLGDVADGYSQVYECVEELLKIKNLITIKGNHDDWFLDWLKYSMHPQRWLQGGFGTLKSYCDYADKSYISRNDGYLTKLLPEDIPESHINFFKQQHNYYIDEKNRLFVHGGFNRHLGIKEQQIPYIYYWDRDLWNSALSYEAMSEESKSKNKFKTKDNFSEIYIGHTQTTNWTEDDPDSKGGIRRITHYMKAANIYNCDTGAGWNTGRLCMMNIDTKEAFYSDLGMNLYLNEQGK